MARPVEEAHDERRRRALISALRDAVPADCVLERTEELRAFECDAFTAQRAIPWAVVLPRTEEEVRRTLMVCHRLDVPVVARGAGTGLSGGAIPHPEGVVLSLARLNRIVEIDPVARWARVQPGVRNLAVSEAAAPFGLCYAPDPSSQIACSIGGNVAENSGGVHSLKYGLTVHNVLGVRGYLPDGEPIELGGRALDGPGLDLLAVVIGSEGLLMIVTEVTLRLIPRPASARVAVASFDDVVAAGEAVAAIIASGIIPAGLELMDRKAIAAVEPFARAGYDLSAEALLLVEADGTPEEVDDTLGELVDLLGTRGATNIRVSQSEEERLRYWSGRKSAFPAAGRLAPDYYCMDGTIPRKQIGHMLQAIADMEKRYGLSCLNVFHAGDGNLHPLILFDANQPGEWARAERFGAEILERCVELGGTITGEHGVGIEKIDSMCVQFSQTELAAFARLKSAFDTKGLLNPGKAIPTLARCAEHGRMHVRRGGLPHPDLPRF